VIKMTETEQVKIQADEGQEKGKSGGFRAAYYGVLMKLRPNPTTSPMSSNCSRRPSSAPSRG
jgi:hypothetical protein